MPSRFQSRAWRRCRTCFRAFRILVLCLLLFVIGAGYYLNQIGVPDFLKRALVVRLHERGIDLKFTRLRWRYYRGLVAENVRFGQADAPGNGPGFSAQEVELKLNHGALRHFEFTVDSVILHGGQLVWPLNQTNQAPRSLSIDGIQSQLRFLENDRWELDRFNATFAGASLQVSGAITNASALRDWKLLHATPNAPAQPARLQQRLNELADTLDRIKFSDTPELKLFVRGDGSDPQSFAGLLTVRTRGAETPWGSLTNGYLLARLLAPAATNRQPHGDFVLYADHAATRWGDTEKFELHLEAMVDPAQTNLIHCELNLQADRFATEWAQAANARLTAEWAHSLTNPVPVAGHAELHLSNPHTAWGQAGELLLETRLSEPAAQHPRQADAGWAWWADLEPYCLDWNCVLREARAREFQVKEIAFGGSWRAPELAITNLHSELYAGRLDLQAAVNVATRAASFSAGMDFDAHSIAPLLSPGLSRWLDQYSWEKPPVAAGRGAVVLPAWTNRHPDWHGEVFPTFSLEADIDSGPAAWRKVWALGARLHVSYSNEVCHIPDLVAICTNGQVHLALTADDRTQDYQFRIHSGVDLKPFRILLDAPEQQRAFDSLVLTEPPEIDAEIWGRWHDYERIGIKAQIALTNFTLRGESATNLHAGLQYTNHYLLFDHPRVERGAQYASADSVGVNFDTRQLFLTHGFSTLEPLAILHAVGPKVTQTMEPYHFLQPPTVRANGIIPLEDDVAANVRFDIDGGPFQWTRFNLAHVSGGADWVGDHLALTGMQAEFYGGRMEGSAAFDFSPGKASPFSFDTTVTGANLGSIMAGVFNASNHLEGTLNGRLTVNRADADDWKSWFGRGAVDLHDGLIWDIPLFGVFSKVLDAFVPGSGESRASQGAATVVITNSVIRTGDLKINAPALSMLYRGTSDFDGRVDAVVEAEVLRNTWVVGPLISSLLKPFTKIFEYSVSGTLANPKPQPRWLLIKSLFAPFELLFHPVNTLKEAFPTNPGGTNAPAAPQPPPAPAAP